MTIPALVAGGIGILVALIWVGALFAEYKRFGSIPSSIKAAALFLFFGSLGLIVAAPYAKVIVITEKLTSSGD